MSDQDSSERSPLLAGRTEESATVAGRRPRKRRRIVGRISRWVFYSVVLALVPIMVAGIFLPKDSSLIEAISKGELAIVAGALTGAGIGELLAMARNIRGWRNFLISLNIGGLVGAIVVLAGVLGNAGHLTHEQAIICSEWLLGIAIVVGITSQILFAITEGST